MNPLFTAVVGAPPRDTRDAARRAGSIAAAD
jgi:hypothetical protein